MSLVFTDPKGELYRKLTKYLETKGYDVKVFNLVNPTYSNAANFIKFVEDETDAEIFSKIVIISFLAFFLPSIKSVLSLSLNRFTVCSPSRVFIWIWPS
mgnify:CR=1 FL=1